MAAAIAESRAPIVGGIGKAAKNPGRIGHIFSHSSRYSPHGYVIRATQENGRYEHSATTLNAFSQRPIERGDWTAPDSLTAASAFDRCRFA